MLLDQETLRFIFGMKLRNLRQEKKLSLQELANVTDLSPSYINEIEKGKKYPKTDKILVLADALGVSYDDLISVRLSTELAHLARIFERGHIKALPLHIFGIPAQAIMETMADAPQKFSSLVGTLLEIARLYDIRVEEVFVACLKAYIDMNGNFFPDLESKAIETRQALLKSLASKDKSGDKEITSDWLADKLKRVYHYNVENVAMSSLGQDLERLLFLYVPGDAPRLLISESLSERERAYVLAKALGYEVLGLDERFVSSFTGLPDSFEKLLHNFRASYFAGALLIDREQLSASMRKFFEADRWNGEEWGKMFTSAHAPYHAVMHRMAQILPREFGIDRLFLIEMEHNQETEAFSLSKQLHLSDLHAPHRVSANEKYCRRWITVRMLQEAAASSKGRFHMGLQRSRFVTSQTEYVSLALCYPKEGQPGVHQCATLGIQINEHTRRAIRFLSDPKIIQKDVGDTCESCAITGCGERAAPPNNIRRRHHDEALQSAIQACVARLGSDSNNSSGARNRDVHSRRR